MNKIKKTLSAFLTILLFVSAFGVTAFAEGGNTTLTTTIPCTVTFSTGGHGTAPDAVIVESGKTAQKPDDPTEEGWVFGGWFTEEECANAFDFSTAITADITLYARWTKEGTSSEPTQTGDSGSLSLWTMLAAASLAACFGAIVFGKKRKIKG